MVDTGGDDTTTGFRRHEHLWYEDGNIVFLSQNVAFKLYKGILARRASFFSDLFTVPQPQGSEQIDGCPVVMMRDSAMDLEYYFRSVFDIIFFLPPPAKTAYPVMSAVLRLSHKYDDQDLKIRALRHLSSQFPVLLQDEQTKDGELDLFSRHPADKIDAISLCKEVGSIWCLPSLYYLLISEGNLHKAIEGYAEGDRITRLDERDVILCVKGREEIDQEGHNLANGFIGFGNAVCKLLSCTSRRQIAMRDFYEDHDPLHFGTNLRSDLEDFSCPDCFQECLSRYDTAQQELWDILPSFFDLPSWNELKQLKRAAIGYDSESRVPVNARV